MTSFVSTETQEQSSTQDTSSQTDTDVNAMMDSKQENPVLHETSGVAKTCVCPVCGLEIFSGLALIRHMRSVHPDMKPYLCEMCESSFNNLKEVSSHKSVVHRKAEVACKSLKLSKD